MKSAAFSASMRVGALRLPDTIAGMMEASTTRSPSMPRTRVCPSVHRALVGPHPAGAAGVEGGFGVLPHEGVDRVVRAHARPRGELLPAPGVEGGLREDLPREAHRVPAARAGRARRRGS